MQTEQDVEHILKEIERFRILCVGRSGSGKSSLITRVFRLGPDQPTAQDWTPGKVDIEKEFTSEGNKLFALHDSEGFEPGNENSFNTVDAFIRRRRDETLPLKEQLHVVWLCIELPTSGQRPFETADENVLQLAHKTKTPMVVVFTKYDRLLASKKDEFGESLGSEKTKEVYETCVQSLKDVVNRMKPPIPVPIFVKASGRPGYEDTIELLVTKTRDHVSSQLKVMWEAAQRASIRITIEGCVKNALLGIKPEGLKLGDCLAKVHQNIVAYWNFVGDEKTLNSNDFKDLMLCLVQDFENPQTLAINLTPDFIEWLSETDLNELAAQQHLMAYVADLITVLNLLFEKVTQPSPLEAPKVTRQALNDGYQTQAPKVTRQALTDVHQTHKTSDTRRKIYHRISTEFLTAQDLSSMLEVLRSLLLQSLGYPMLPPDPESTRGGASSSLSPGVAASSRPTEIATSLSLAEVAPPPTQSTGQPHQSTGKPPQSSEKPPQGTGEPAPQPRSDSPNVWSRFIGCLTNPC